MEIESSRGWRATYLILGLLLAGGSGTLGIVTILRSGPSLVLVTMVFPIGLGIASILWLGRPAWLKVSATEVSYVPPLGSAKVFPRSSVKRIVRVPSARGGAGRLEFRDQDNRNLVVIEQGFAKDDMEKLAQLLNSTLTWDLDMRNASVEEMIAMMTPEEHAKIMARMSPDERAAEMEMMTPEQRIVIEREMNKSGAV